MTITPRIPIPVPRYQPHPQLLREDDDDPPTLRIPVPYPPLPACPLETTPAPVRQLASSSFATAEQDDAPAPLPNAGETVQGFALVEELGRGAFARVYLAKQDSLANRLVALKITRKETHEADKLARLQHANIVPIHSVHMEGALQLICMPFHGRRTIADALRVYQRDHPSKAQSGRRTWGTRRARTTALNSSGTSSGGRLSSNVLAVPVAVPEGPCPPLVGDVSAVLRAIAALAAGLAHAHSRNILHLDIKPANVLLADSGEPMLLDFNLSKDTGEAARDMVGGTVQYMSPEQLYDVRSHGRGQVDARSDLYSLGVLAYEMLTAAVPFPAPSQRNNDFDALITSRSKRFPSARSRNPEITHAVEAILQKLLAPNPDHRYQSADELRADILRHLANEPLQHAPNRSLTERVRKWRRRNPWVPARFAAAALLGLALGSVLAAERQAATGAQAVAANQARALRAMLPTTRLDLVLPDDPQSRERGTMNARNALHSYGLPRDPYWQQREPFARIAAADRNQVAGELGELLLLLAHAQWNESKFLSDAPRAAATAECLKLNALAFDCFPADALPPFARRQRQELAHAAGAPLPQGEPRESSTARDHFLDGVELVTAGRYAAAAKPLDAVVAAQPDHAAAHFLLALCRHKLGQHARALERYDAARVLMPTDPRPFFFRGLVLGLEQKPALAEAEFGRAIALDPDYALAYQNRAVARLGQRKFREAEDDLSAALARSASPLQARLLRAHVRMLLGDTPGAAADRAVANALEPEREADYLVRGWTRMETDPNAALADYVAAAKLNPRSIAALEKQAFVLAEHLNDPAAALALFTKLTELYPEYARGHVGRAVLLARLGQRNAAHEAANRAKMLSDEPGVIFRIACVYSRTSTTHPADRTAALAFLRQAYREGYRDVRAIESDRDLDPLRLLPEFAEFLRAAKELAR